jgi:M6 family metalloprotease-like protein
MATPPTTSTPSPENTLTPTNTPYVEELQPTGPPAPPPLIVGGETLVGYFGILWGDPSPDAEIGPSPTSQPQILYFLTLDDGRTIQLTLDEATTRPSSGLLDLDRKRVIANGIWSNAPQNIAPGDMPVFHVAVIQLEVSHTLDTPAAPSISGPQPWITLMCKFSDIITEPRALSFFQNMYSNTYPRLDHYWREQSFSIINVVGSGATGWYTLPHPRSYYIPGTSANLDLLLADCTAEADLSVNYTNYVGINMMFNSDLDGYAWGGYRYITLDGTYRKWYLTWEPPWGYADISVIEHEMGHGFGLPHSSGQYGYTYDNYWDVMSKDRLSYLAPDATYGRLGQHTISYHKDILSWFTASQKFTAPANSLTTITLERLALPQTTNYRMAKIPIAGSVTHFYTVEARMSAGYDQNLPGQAIIIHEVDTTRQRPAQVIDTDGNGNTGDAGAMWTVGETFSDVANIIYVTVNSMTATGFVVTIQRGTVTTVTHTPTRTATRTPTRTGTSTTTPTRTATRTRTPTATNPPVAGSVFVTGAYTTDGDWAAKSTFKAGEAIKWVLIVQNDGTATQNVQLTYNVRGPGNQSVAYWNGTITTDPGVHYWGLSGIAPNNMLGTHTFYGTAKFNTYTSNASALYFMTGVRFYMPMILRAYYGLLETIEK